MKRLLFATVLAGVLVAFVAPQVSAQLTGNDSVGMQGRISSPPPTVGATISVPRTGQNFSQLPVTVSGICPKGLLVKIFKNNVFAGSADCQNGSFSILIDLFNGQNDLVARVYDSLDQAGPDSNTVTVTFSDNRTGASLRPSLTSNYAKRGANPGQTLVWPIILSGGSGPYAISVDWGDGKPPDLMSLGFPGPFDIKHVYDTPGVYNVVVKAVDREGGTAFLQLVAVANGPLSQDQAGEGEDDKPETKTIILWWPMAILIPLLFVAFWLGGRNKMKIIRKKIERGERPF